MTYLVILFLYNYFRRKYMANENIPKDYDIKKEKFWEQKWQDGDVYKFIGDGTRPRYVIDTPPPYPTGSIHLGHVLNWVYIDMNARYRRLKGMDVLFTQGWDRSYFPSFLVFSRIFSQSSVVPFSVICGIPQTA